MKNKLVVWSIVIISLLIFSAISTILIGKHKLSNIGIEECECSNEIKCPISFSCVISEGESCGKCKLFGGKSGTSSTSAPSQPSQ